MVYGLLATACGWTMEEIDRLTFPEFALLTRYWCENPPVHLLLGALLGRGPKKQGGWDELAELMGVSEVAKSP